MVQKKPADRCDELCSMSLTKRRVLYEPLPLEHGAVVLRVLQLVGPKERLFVPGIAKQWRRVYGQMWPEEKPHQSTNYRAIFASQSRLQLACECGFSEILAASAKAWGVTEHAGQYADLKVLQLAVSLGLRPDEHALLGAVRARSLDKVQYLWPLVEERSDHLDMIAGLSGCVAVMQFLVQQGLEVQPTAMSSAAGAGHLDLVRYLRSIFGSEGEWDAQLLYGAAEGNQLCVLKWANAQAYITETHKPHLAEAAATGCNLAVIQWIQHHFPGAFDSTNLIPAVMLDEPHALEVCQYLVSIGCEVTPAACEAAATVDIPDVLRWYYQLGCCELRPLLCTLAAEHIAIETLRWLHEEVHCPWDVWDVALISVQRGYRSDILQYLQEQGETFTDEGLTDLLNCTVACVDHEMDLTCAKWLRSHGAPWPAVLSCRRYNGWVEHDWPELAVEWARREGCTAPLWSEIPGNGDDSGSSDDDDDDADVNGDNQQNAAE